MAILAASAFSRKDSTRRKCYLYSDAVDPDVRGVEEA